MGKHFRQVATTLTPLAFVVGFLLTRDIPTALAQADRSAAQIASALGIPNSPEHMASYVWDHPFLAIIGVVLLLASGAGASWLIEWACKRWAEPSSPIRVADKLHIDCDPVGRRLGGPAFHLYSAAFCIDLENASDKTIRGVKAVYRNPWGDDSPLRIRNSTSGTVDLHPRDKARIEVGRMTMQMEPNHVPGIERGEGYWVLSDGDINHAYNPEKEVEYFEVSSVDAHRLMHIKGKEMTLIDVLITAADTPPRMARLGGDLWNERARERLKITSTKRQK